MACLAKLRGVTGPSSKEAIQLLLRLAEDKEPTTVAVAVGNI